MQKRTPEVQLEIAAHWLLEAASLFSDLKHYDAAQNMRRVAKQSAEVLKAVKAKETV